MKQEFCFHCRTCFVPGVTCSIRQSPRMKLKLISKCGKEKIPFDWSYKDNTRISFHSFIKKPSTTQDVVVSTLPWRLITCVDI